MVVNSRNVLGTTRTSLCHFHHLCWTVAMFVDNKRWYVLFCGRWFGEVSLHTLHPMVLLHSSSHIPACINLKTDRPLCKGCIPSLSSKPRKCPSLALVRFKERIKPPRGQFAGFTGARQMLTPFSWTGSSRNLPFCTQSQAHIVTVAPPIHSALYRSFNDTTVSFPLES